jgi:RimJ/RimL family protein N-acetyltransferase
MQDIRVRSVEDADLPVFVAYESDPVACAMVGMRIREPEASMAHWRRSLADPSNVIRTVVMNDQVVGNVVSYVQDGKREVGYWIGREYWGHGVATSALAQFLPLIATRPLYAHVATHNTASRRVLEKCGFALESQTDAELSLVLRS